LLKEKKRALEKKNAEIEELKVKISQESSKKCSNIKISPTKNDENNPRLANKDSSIFDKTIEKNSFSVINTSILQDVSSRFSLFVDKMRGKKSNNNILTPEVLQEINLKSLQTGVFESKLLNNKRKSKELNKISNSGSLFLNNH